ncbi:MAG: hypothetical protein IPG65_12735 [Ottowia sp.]|nr:hypothetical protein [Ottowia sp.]
MQPRDVPRHPQPQAEAMRPVAAALPALEELFGRAGPQAGPLVSGRPGCRPAGRT